MRKRRTARPQRTRRGAEMVSAGKPANVAAQLLSLGFTHEDARDYMAELALQEIRRRHDALSHPHSAETKRRIGLASRARAATAARDHRGRFSG